MKTHHPKYPTYKAQYRTAIKRLKRYKAVEWTLLAISVFFGAIALFTKGQLAFIPFCIVLVCYMNARSVSQACKLNVFSQKSLILTVEYCHANKEYMDWVSRRFDFETMNSTPLIHEGLRILKKLIVCCKVHQKVCGRDTTEEIQKLRGQISTLLHT